MSRTKILVGGNADLIRNDVVRCLKSLDNVEVVEQASGGVEAITYTHHYNPHVVLLGMEMAGVSGSKVAAQIKRFSPETKIVFVTSQDRRPVRRRSKFPDADWFISERTLETDLATVLEQVRHGAA